MSKIKLSNKNWVRYQNLLTIIAAVNYVALLIAAIREYGYFAGLLYGVSIPVFLYVGGWGLNERRSS
jgi:hypothetical protein